MKLSDREWKTFYISDEKDNGIFKLRSSLSGIDKNKLIDCKNLAIPYITRSDFNNGVSMFVGNEQNVKYKIDNGNVITIGLDTQTVFYQPHSFYTGQNVQVLYNEHLNKYVAKFIIPLLKMQVSKLSWGGNGATLGRLKRMQLMLPISDDGKPDYVFMEDFINEREAEKRTQYQEYVGQRLVELGIDVQNINVEEYEISFEERQWKDFSVPYVFQKIQRGKRLKNDDHVPGKSPYVSSTANNNGVDDYIEVTNGERVFENCISLANSGSVGTAFYEPFTFVASDHVTSLKRENTSKYVYLFLATVLEKQGSNFNFNREINDLRIKRMRIMIPVDDNSEPDYDFMEKCGRKMVAKKYIQYLNFLESLGRM